MPIKAEMAQWLERHEMQRHRKFAGRRLAVAQIGGHPAAADPRISESRIECQSAFKTPFGLLETMRQHQCTATQGERQGIVRRKLAGFVG
jgi:hypothetical protein